MDLFIKFCEENGIKILLNEPLCNHLTFKVGGECAAMVFPHTESLLLGCIGFLRNNKVKHYIIGNGSNLIASDIGYDGVIINTCDFRDIKTEYGEYIECSAGVPLINICRYALDNSLTGIEFAYGIPGTAGGAIYMNAGAYGGEMKDIIDSVRYLDTDGEIRTARFDELELGYRKSMFTGTDLVILSLCIKLNKGNPDNIEAEMKNIIGRRKDKQPLEYPSAGSTFKRPEGYYAGALIEECGLKGYSVGGACVSEKHAGFVINKGGASCSDILAVIDHCRKTVYEQTGVTLETEVRFIQ